MKRILQPVVLLYALTIFSCVLSEEEKQNNVKQTDAMTDTLDGKAVKLYTLTNASGMKVGITNYGATIVSIEVPDKTGKMADVTTGYDSLHHYYNGGGFFGCVAGRYANRIAKGKFTLNGTEYNLFVNNGVNALHGGKRGFNKYVWDASQQGNELKLTMTSPDGDEGYPGKLDVTVTYTLTDSNELVLDYEAVTDKPTVLNLTNHAYFNLGGVGSGDILGHEMQIFAAQTTPVDSTLIPTGKLAPVKGTAFDFLEPHTIGERINADEEQIRYGGGYDHNFVLKEKASDELVKAAVVHEPVSGRVMTVFTTQPGVQFYTGNFLNGSEKGKGAVYTKRSGFCLETQHFPDSPNQPAFPSTVLNPGETFKSRTIYQFSVRP